MSGHFGLDFSNYSSDAIVQNIEVPGIQGLFESIIYAKGGAPVTVKEAAMIYAQGMGMPVAVGTPEDIADQMEHYMDEGGADGFMLDRDLHARMFRGIRRSRSKHARRKIQPLGDIVVLLGDRIGVIDAERAERRIPDQAGADRRADRARIGDLL